MAINSKDSSSRIKHKQGSSPRRLFEILEEKQEPFVLEIYLLERGCSVKSLKFDNKVNHIGCFSNNNQNNKNLLELKELKSVRKSSRQFSSIAKNLLSKIVLVKEVVKQKHSSKEKKKKKKSLSESDTDEESISSPTDNRRTRELTVDRVISSWRFTEENKQCSPNSVLDEIDLLQGIPVFNGKFNETFLCPRDSGVKRNDEELPRASRIRFTKKVSEDSILSASLWEMLEQAKQENSNKFGSKSYTKYMNSKKALQQTRQLLFDCVREVVETQSINGGNKQRIISKEKGLMGPEEIGKIMCNNMKIWGQFPSKKRSAIRLVTRDLLSSDGKEWGRSDEVKREIVKEIGDGIYEEIIDDIVKEMVDNQSFCT
ncbi:hypothetical protein KSS87_023296 [Heliosperma pusillum]|nr:hypothetical protein KSS87_023257 [Heliosperma pusillum]KAH9625429.1 hypothetical protein KSS87_023296 [Heliosperma pusillum]